MLKQMIITAMAVTLAVSAAAANQTNNKVTIQVTKTTANDGKQMYTSYCAPCHGVDGRGHGPAAAALKVQPIDLTNLSKNNRGKFPDSHIVTVLQFGSEIPAHGSPQMPVWGPILGNLNHSSPQD